MSRSARLQRESTYVASVGAVAAALVISPKTARAARPRRFLCGETTAPSRILVCTQRRASQSSFSTRAPRSHLTTSAQRVSTRVTPAVVQLKLISAEALVDGLSGVAGDASGRFLFFDAVDDASGEVNRPPAPRGWAGRAAAGAARGDVKSRPFWLSGAGAMPSEGRLLQLVARRQSHVSPPSGSEPSSGATTVSIDVAAVLSASFLRLCGNQAMS